MIRFYVDRDQHVLESSQVDFLALNNSLQLPEVVRILSSHLLELGEEK